MATVAMRLVRGYLEGNVAVKSLVDVVLWTHQEAFIDTVVGKGYEDMESLMISLRML
jgi:hypothetical protein